MVSTKMMVIAGLGVALVGNGMAQERTAAGHLSQEASWTALKTLADAANSRATMAQVTANSALDKANKIEACGRKGMLFAPGVSGADAGGCLAVSSSPKAYAVGSYMLARTVGGSSYAPGNLVPGGYLYPSGITPSKFSNNTSILDGSTSVLGSSLPGTWMAMGYLNAGDPAWQRPATLFLRVD